MTPTGIVRDRLAFRDDGRFTIVQFNDTQDGHRTDRRTLALQAAVLDDVRPDLAVINGDVIDGASPTALETKQALNNVVLPMEERGIPWAITFGNHDADSAHLTGLDEEDLLAFVAQYRHNLNTAGAHGVTGSGNQVLAVRASASRSGRGADAAVADGPAGTGAPSAADTARPADAFAVWLLDSGRYAPAEIAGQGFEGYPGWDWVRPDQVRWYLDASEQLERDNGRPVPGLAFQHIALWEHRFMWFASQDGRSDADHARAVARHGITGERHEAECTGPFNAGLFAAMLQRGDVRGVYVGHDHTNTYSGDYYGIRLGYGPGTGFGTYGLDGDDEHRLRGARVFELDEAADGVLASTRPLFATDYGIDTTPGTQRTDPAPFPAGVS